MALFSLQREIIVLQHNVNQNDSVIITIITIIIIIIIIIIIFFFFRTWATFEAGGGPVKKNPHPPFKTASYGSDLKLESV